MVVLLHPCQSLTDGPPASPPACHPLPRREGGWAGAAFSDMRPSLLAVARGCARDVTLYDGARRLRTMRTSTQPYALAFLAPGHHSGGGDALALAEGDAVSRQAGAWGGWSRCELAAAAARTRACLGF